MTDNESRYEVMWGQGGRVKLAGMKPFKIDPKLVFRNSKSILAVKPRGREIWCPTYFPDFED